MDQRADGEFDPMSEIVLLEYKQECAENAQTYCEKLILSTGGPDSREAIESVFQFGAYYLEWLTWRFSIESLEMEKASGSLRESRQEDNAVMREEKLGLEAALGRAQEGDYSSFKDWLLHFGEDYREMYVETREVGERMLGIARHLPSLGSPLKLPQPAWMDPRFNGEGASQ